MAKLYLSLPIFGGVMIRVLVLRDFRAFCNRLNNNIRDIFSYLPERVCLKLAFLYASHKYIKL